MKDKVIKLKEEKNLMKKLLVISRSRPGIDAGALFKIHEFSVVPSIIGLLFDRTAARWKCTGKSYCLDGLTDLGKKTPSSDPALVIAASPFKCLVIDGMGIVNKLKI